MYSFNIIITEICNANCSHCYMKNDSNKKTLTTKQIDTLIKKLPSNTKSIVLTGGEIYMVKNLLFYTLEKINERFSNIIISVESNGKYFYENKDKIRNELSKLEEYNVSFIRFSDDVFHADGGINLDEVRKIKDYSDGLKIQVKYLVQKDALPIGKGSDLPDELKAKKECMNTVNTYENPYLFLDINGNIYTCAWKCTPSVGNIFTDSFLDIENNLYSGVQKEILIGNIEGILKNNENYDKYKKIVQEQGTCMACYKYFKESR